MSAELAQSQIPLTLETKQRLSMRRTAEIKRTATEAKIKAAIEWLQADGKKVTQKAVAEISRLGIATVKRNWKAIKMA